MKKYINVIALSIFSLGLIITLPIWALGDTTTTSTTVSTPPTTITSQSHPVSLIVQIEPNGHALIRGIVTNIGTDSLSLKSWGGEWKISVDSQTKFLPNDINLSQIKEGDFLGLNGIVSKDETLTIKATLIRDWTEKKVIHQETQQNKKEVKQIIKETTPSIKILTVESLDPTNNTITAKINSTTVTIKLAANAKILDRNWKTITLSQIKAGDIIRTYGTLSESTLEASVIRDISLSNNGNTDNNKQKISNNKSLTPEEINKIDSLTPDEINKALYGQ